MSSNAVRYHADSITVGSVKEKKGKTMNEDEKFKQRWEFRRKEDDADSSSDDDHKVTNKQHKFCTDLIVLNDDESDDTNRVTAKVPEKEVKKIGTRKKNDSDQKKESIRSSNKNDSDKKENINSKKKKDSDKKENINSKKKKDSDNKENIIKSSRKKEPIQKKPKKSRVDDKCCNKKKVNPNDVVMFEHDLSVFCDSVIHDLFVARVNMFANMRQDMEMLTGLKPCLEQKKKRIIKRSQKAKVSNRSSTEPRTQSKKRKLEPSVVSGPSRSDAKALDNCIEQEQTREGVSSIINNNSQPRTGHLKLPTEFNTFRSAFPSFSEINGKGVNFLGQNNFTQTTSHGIGFMSPIRQILENASAISSLTYSGNSVKDKSDEGHRMKLNVGSEHVLFQTE